MKLENFELLKMKYRTHSGESFLVRRVVPLCTKEMCNFRLKSVCVSGFTE